MFLLARSTALNQSFTVCPVLIWKTHNDLKHFRKLTVSALFTNNLFLVVATVLSDARADADSVVHWLMIELVAGSAIVTLFDSRSISLETSCSERRFRVRRVLSFHGQQSGSSEAVVVPVHRGFNFPSQYRPSQERAKKGLDTDIAALVYPSRQPSNGP